MPRLIRRAAAAAAIAAVGAAPASAQTPEPQCDNLPTCVNYTLDTVERTRHWLEGHPGPSVVDQVMCLAYEVGTGEECPAG